MSRTIHTTTSPVTLEGYQAVMKPSQYGYSLRAVVGPELIKELEEELEMQKRTNGMLSMEIFLPHASRLAQLMHWYLEIKKTLRAESIR